MTRISPDNYRKARNYDIIRYGDATQLTNGLRRRVLDSGAVFTFRPGATATVTERRNIGLDSFLYEIDGDGVTVDTSSLKPENLLHNKNNNVKQIDVVIKGNKNRVISPFETNVALRGKNNILGSGSKDDNIHIVSDDNIFANVGGQQIITRHNNPNQSKFVTNSINIENNQRV